MASEDVKQRKRNETESEDAGAVKDADGSGSKKAKRRTMAKRGLKSLALAVSIPVSLTMLTIYLVSPRTYGPPSKPFWFPSITAINMASVVSSFLMVLSAWLVWAEGGFHTKPAALYLYCLYLALCPGWYALVLGAGAGRLGSAACLGIVGALVGCRRVFKGVNPIAADLVKPCLAWSAFLTIVNLTLISL